MEAFDYRPNLFPRLTRVANILGKLTMLPNRTNLALSEHRRGASQLLDDALDSQGQLEFGE